MQRWLPAVVMLLLSPVVFAAQPVDFTLAVPGVALIVAAFLGIMSMMATALSDPRLEAWVKTEIREFAAALILAAIVIGFFAATGGNELAAALGGTGSANYVQSSVAVLDKWLGSYDSAFTTAIRAAAKIRVGATYSPYISVPLWWVSVNYATSPLAGSAILLLPLNLAAGGLTNALYLAEGMRMLIVFMLVTGPRILLPLSLCLRFIPFTRKLGNTMIAVSIAGMVLLPASVLIADALNGTLVDAQGRSTVPNPSMDLSVIDKNNPWAMNVFQWACAAIPIRAILGMTEQGFAAVICAFLLLLLIGAVAFPACYAFTSQVVYPILMTVFQAVNAITLITWEAGFSRGSGAADYANAVFNELFGFLRDVNNLVFLGYIDFIIIGLITVVGARSLSAALGGEWYLAGIQRLI